MVGYALLIDGDTVFGISNNNAKSSKDVIFSDVLSWTSHDSDNGGNSPSSLTASFKSALEALAIKDGVPLALPPDILVTRVLTLPATDSESLSSMVRLAMEKFAPVSDNDLEVDYEVVSATESSTRVFAVCVPNSTLDKIASDLEAAGLLITRLDSSLLCEWHSYARLERISPESVKAVIFATASGRLDLIIADETGPLFARTLGNKLTQADLTREIILTLMDFSSENNATQIDAIDLVINKEASSSMLETAIQNATGISPAIIPESDLFPFVASTLLREEEDGCIDIVPNAWREEEELSISRQKFKTGIIAAIAIWVIIAASFYIIPWLQTRKTASLDKNIKALTPAYRQVNELRSRVRLITTYEDRSFSFIDTFKTICEEMTPGITLTSLSYDKGSEALVNGKPSPGGFKLSGTSEASSQVNEFVDGLNAMGIFQPPKLTGPNLVSGSAHYKFEIDIKFGGNRQ